MLVFSKRLSLQMFSIVLVTVMLTITHNARSASNDSSNHGVRLARPAVVRIITRIEGKVVCNGCAQDGSTLTFPSEENYIYPVTASGSGTLISPDGYILTAKHVVDIQRNDTDIQAKFLQSAIEDYAKTHGVSVDEASQFFKQHLDKLTLPYQVTERKVFLSTDYTGPLQNSAPTSYPTHIVVQSPSDSQEDVAILKVEAQQDLPYLTLALASSIHTLDNVTAITFPVDAEVSSSFTDLTDPTRSSPSKLTDLLTPSAETGQVTKEGRLSDGTQVYETTPIVASGSSGGPIINAQGQIIGFADLISGNERVAFLMPSKVATSYTRQAGIAANPQAGAFMSLWTKAINEYDGSWACHWTQANQDLKQLHEKYPQFGGVQSFLNDAQAKATPSECPPPPTRNWLRDNWPLLAGLAALLILAGTGLFLFVFSTRRKPMPQPAEMTTSRSTGPISADVPTRDSGVDWSEQTTEMHSGIWVPSTSPKPAPATRKCTSGHVVTIETGHFCPECGAPIESKIPQG